MLRSNRFDKYAVDVPVVSEEFNSDSCKFLNALSNIPAFTEKITEMSHCSYVSFSAMYK